MQQRNRKLCCGIMPGYELNYTILKMLQCATTLFYIDYSNITEIKIDMIVMKQLYSPVTFPQNTLSHEVIKWVICANILHRNHILWHIFSKY